MMDIVRLSQRVCGVGVIDIVAAAPSLADMLASGPTCCAHVRVERKIVSVILPAAIGVFILLGIVQYSFSPSCHPVHEASSTSGRSVTKQRQRQCPRNSHATPIRKRMICSSEDLRNDVVTYRIKTVRRDKMGELISLRPN